MSLITSISFSDEINSLKYSSKKTLTEIEAICLDNRTIPEMPSLLSENIFQTINLPLRCHNYELVAISFVVSARNLVTGQVFATSLDPCIALPRANDSIMLDNIAFHPVNPDSHNNLNFT